jgi:hypothetical protein
MNSYKLHKTKTNLALDRPRFARMCRVLTNSMTDENRNRASSGHAARGTLITAKVRESCIKMLVIQVA